MRDELLAKFEQVESKHWWWEGRRRLIADFIDGFPGKRRLKLLDVGCGTGETMLFIKKRRPKYEIWGIDKSRVAIRYASGRGLKSVKLADANKLPFTPDTFDAVFALDVLEHIKNPGKVLGEVKRVLKPGGVIFITSPALKFIWSRHDAGQGHVTRFDKDELRKLGEEAGLEVDWVRYFNFYLSGPIILIRILSRFPGLGFVAGYDNGINYGVVKFGWLNNLLASIFTAETGRIHKINYPWGISVAAEMIKPSM